MKIDIIGGDQLVKDISKRVGRQRVNNVIKKATADVQREAMRNVPVDTGFLKRSITLELQPERLTGTVIAGAEYAPYVEFGTRYNFSQPFMRPARNKVQPIFLSDMKNLLKG